MVRIDDEERVFDVSRPHRSSPSATSKPIIVGHHPLMSDPMMKEENQQEHGLFSSHIEKKVTPVHVTMDEAEPEAGGSLPFTGPKHPKEEFQGAMPGATEPAKEPDETPKVQPDSPTGPQYTSVESLMDEKHDPAPFSASGSDDSEPPISALPMPHPKGAGPRGKGKKIALWTTTLLVLVLAGGYLAVDAKLIDSDIKLPFEIFKEKNTPVATAPVAQKKETQTSGDSEKVIGTCGTDPAEPTNLKELNIDLICPAGWKVTETVFTGGDNVRNVSYRIQSPDFKWEEVEVYPGFMGTEFWISREAAGGNTYNDQRKLAVEGFMSRKDVKDETVGGRMAFRHTATSNEGSAGDSIEVVVDQKGGPVTFTYRSHKTFESNSPSADMTLIGEFNKFLQSVTFLKQ